MMLWASNFDPDAQCKSFSIDLTNRYVPYWLSSGKEFFSSLKQILTCFETILMSQEEMP